MNKLLLAAVLLASPLANAEVCAPYQVSVEVPGDNAVGTVTIHTDETYLYVDIRWVTGSLWGHRLVDIYRGTDPVPVEAGGAPDISSFQIRDAYFSPQGDFTYTFSLADLNATPCHTKLYLAMKLGLEKVDTNGVVTREEVVWVAGPGTFAGDALARWFTYNDCCLTAVTGCTRTAGYYKTHSQYSKPQQWDPWPLSEETQMCGVSWHNILNTKSSDNWFKLATQWIGGMLNMSDGASSPPEVDEALSDGQALLNTTCRAMPKAQKAAATDLTTVLANYNNGLLQPGSCSTITP